MSINLSEIMEKLKKVISLADKTGDKYQFQDPAYEILEELQTLEKPYDAVRPIFELIENSPAIDFGGPGPFGAFLEEFYKKGYEEELVASLKRKPTEYTISLMFRVIADKKNPNIDEYKKLLRAFIDDPCLEQFQFWKDEIAKL